MNVSSAGDGPPSVAANRAAGAAAVDESSPPLSRMPISVVEPAVEDQAALAALVDDRFSASDSGVVQSRRWPSPYAVDPLALAV